MNTSTPRRGAMIETRASDRATKRARMQLRGRGGEQGTCKVGRGESKPLRPLRQSPSCFGSLPAGRAWAENRAPGGRCCCLGDGPNGPESIFLATACRVPCTRPGAPWRDPRRAGRARTGLSQISCIGPRAELPARGSAAAPGLRSRCLRLASRVVGNVEELQVAMLGTPVPQRPERLVLGDYLLGQIAGLVAVDIHWRGLRLGWRR